MSKKTFTIEIEERKFQFERVNQSGNDYFYYIIPCDKDEKGFFMEKDEGGKWAVMNKFVVSERIIRMEATLSEVIVKHTKGSD